MNESKANGLLSKIIQGTIAENLGLIPEATVTLFHILKSLVSHGLDFKSWTKLIYDKITYIYYVINELNPTFEV